MALLLGLDSDTFYIYHVAAVMVDNLRRLLLGTAKTHKVSYKSKKTRKNEEEQRYFFPNTHEPLVDEETFELAQKRIATRHRPTKAAEIDIFWLFGGFCGRDSGIGPAQRAKTTIWN